MMKMKTPDMSTKNQIIQWINSTLNVLFYIKIIRRIKQKYNH
jgi:hypothetical protein